MVSYNFQTFLKICKALAPYDAAPELMRGPCARWILRVSDGPATSIMLMHRALGFGFWIHHQDEDVVEVRPMRVYQSIGNYEYPISTYINDHDLEKVYNSLGGYYMSHIIPIIHSFISYYSWSDTATAEAVKVIERESEEDGILRNVVLVAFNGEIDGEPAGKYLAIYEYDPVTEPYMQFPKSELVGLSYRALMRLVMSTRLNNKYGEDTP